MWRSVASSSATHLILEDRDATEDCTRPAVCVTRHLTFTKNQIGPIRAGVIYGDLRWLTPDPDSSILPTWQDLRLSFPHTDTVDVVCVSLQDRLWTDRQTETNYRQRLRTNASYFPIFCLHTLKTPCSRSMMWTLLSPAPMTRLLSWNRRRGQEDRSHSDCVQLRNQD